MTCTFTRIHIVNKSIAALPHFSVRFCLQNLKNWRWPTSKSESSRLCVVCERFITRSCPAPKINRASARKERRAKQEAERLAKEAARAAAEEEAAIEEAKRREKLKLKKKADAVGLALFTLLARASSLPVACMRRLPRLDSLRPEFTLAFLRRPGAQEKGRGRKVCCGCN